MEKRLAEAHGVPLYAGVPAPSDEWAAEDAIKQIVHRLCSLGYTEEQAAAKTAGLVRQLLRAWGVPVETRTAFEPGEDR